MRIVFTLEDPFYLVESTEDLIQKINTDGKHSIIQAIITPSSPFGRKETFKQKPKQLTEKIKWFIENPEKAILVGKKGQEMFFKHYTLEVFEKRMTHVLNQI